MPQEYQPSLPRHRGHTSIHIAKRRTRARVTHRATAFDLSRFAQLRLNSAVTPSQRPISQEFEQDLSELIGPETNIASTNPNRATNQIAVSDFSRFALKSPSRAYLALRDDLAKQLKPQDAATRESYDPRTIAHDILLAADKHPTGKGLNSHLIPLRGNIPVINYLSDLSTIRWDIIDPGILESNGPNDQRPATPPTTPGARDTCYSPDIDYLPLPQAVSRHLPSLGLERSNARNSGVDRADLALHKQVLGRTPPTSGRRSTRPTDNQATDADPLRHCRGFQCGWVDCYRVFSDIWSFRVHVVRCHVLESQKCGWTKCDYNECLSAFDLWNHVQKGHMEQFEGSQPRESVP